MKHKMNKRVSSYYESNNFFIVISDRAKSFCEQFKYSETGLSACIILNDGKLKFSDTENKQEILCESNQLHDLQNLSLFGEYKVNAIRDSHYCTIYKKDLKTHYIFKKCAVLSNVSCDFIIGVKGQCNINNIELSSPFVVKATQKLNIKPKDSLVTLVIVDIKRD